MNGYASTGRTAGGIMPHRQLDDNDDNDHDEEWSSDHPELTSVVIQGDHHSRTTTSIIGTSHRGSFDGNTNTATTSTTTATATPSIMKEKTKMSKSKHQHPVGDDMNSELLPLLSSSSPSSSLPMSNAIPERPLALQRRIHCHGDNLGGDHPSLGVNSPLKKTSTSTMSINMMTSSPNTTNHRPRVQRYYPPPPYGKRTAPLLPSPTRTTTTSTHSPPPPPPPPPRPSSSQEKQMTSPPPPPPPVWHNNPSSRRSSTSSSSTSPLSNKEVEALAPPPPFFFMASSALFCSVINDTSHNKFKKKGVTFSPSTTGGMTTSSTIKDIDTGITYTATTTSACNGQNEIHDNNNNNKNVITTSISSKKMTKSVSNRGNKKANATITSKHSSSSSDNTSDLLKRVSTVCDSVYTYLEEFDSRKNNNAMTNPTRAVTNNKSNNHKNKNNISKEYSSITSNPENSIYTRRHTTDNSIPNKPASSSSNVDNAYNDTKGHDQMKDLSFTPGSINNISPFVHPRRHSTGTPVSRRHSDSSANAMSRITTATTSGLMGSTSTTSNNNNNSQDGGTSKCKTKGSGSPTTTNCRNDRSFLDVPSPQDVTSSLQSVVRGRQRVRTMYSSLYSTTDTDTVAFSSASTPLSHQQPKQQGRQHPRSVSMDGSATMIRRGGRHNLHRRRSNSSSKYIIDNLTQQVNTNHRNFQRSSSEDDDDDARMNSLMTTKSLLHQLRTSLDDAMAARRRVSLRSRTEHFDHHKVGNSITPSAAAATATSTPYGRISTNCDGEVVIATEKRAADDDNVARQERCKNVKDSSKSSTATTSSIRTRSAVGLRRRGSACSSTESLSAADTSSDCESLISVLRSYRGEENKGGGGGGDCERKKGRKKKLLDIGGLTRRRGSSLSRNAAQSLSSMDSPGRDYCEGNGSHAMEDDSKASMVYDIPFDPITGKCHHHSTVQMAVREEDEDNEKKKRGNSIVTASSDSAVVCGWRIVRTTCPKCKYNY